MEIITAKYVLTMKNGELIENGAIAVELDKIIGVGTADSLKERYPDADIKEYPDCVLMPGLINAHCHLELTESLMARNMTLSEQMAPPDYVDWLITTLGYVSEAPKEELIKRTQDGANELINSGHTCVGNMTCYEGSINILSEMGLRATIFLQISSGFSKKAQDLFETSLGIAEKHLNKKNDLIQVGLGPYAPYLLSRQLLKILCQHAKNGDIIMQTHASESFSEMELFFNSQGPLISELFPSIGWTGEPPPANYKTPINYLDNIGFLEAQPSIVGCVHLSNEDYRSLSRHMTRIIYCPRNNQLMQHGKLPLGKLQQNGIPIALGSNFAIGPLGNSLWEEMRLALKVGSDPLPTAKDLLHMATIGGARALRVDHLTGTLEEGKLADFIVVLAPKVESTEELWDALIKNTKTHFVKEVVVNGQILKACAM